MNLCVGVDDARAQRQRWWAVGVLFVGQRNLLGSKGADYTE
jgi:hypothetical protein